MWCDRWIGRRNPRRNKEQDLMKGRLAVIGLLLLLAGSLSTSRAQTADDALRFAHQWPATGARMTGMAGAGIAGIADYGALFANPAGLGYFETSQAAGTFSVLQVLDDAQYQVGDLSPVPSDQTSSQYGLGNAALVYKFPTKRGSLVFAGGINQTGTFERTLDYAAQNSFNSITDTFLPFSGNYQIESDGSILFDFAIPRIAFNAGAIEFFQGDFDAGRYPFLQAVTPGTTIEQREEVIEEGRITEANFGGAVEAAEGVMVGASLNVAFGTYTFDRFYREIDINNENTPDLYSVLVEGDTLRGFDQLEVSQVVESDLAGVSIRVGMSAQLTPELRGGIMLETPTYYSVDETFGTRMTTFFDTGETLSNGSTDANTFEYNVRTPWRLGAGLSYSGENLTVAGDIELIDWTQLELDSDDANFPEVNQRIRDFDMVVHTRVGAEYRLGDLALRGGLAYQPDPRPTEEDIQLPGNETTDHAQTYYTAGLSYRLDEQLQFHFGWMQERFDDQYRPYSSITVPGEGVEIVAPFVDEEVVRNRFLFGITYSF